MGLSRTISLLAAVVLGGCATVEVSTDHDRSVDFSRYNTYYWKQLPTTTNPLMNGRIASAVDGQLFARGWRKVPESQAQTALAADFTTREGQRVDTYHHNWGPGWVGWGMSGPVMSTSHLVTYHVGTLVLDLYDANSRNAIWRGTASDVLPSSPERMQKTLDEGVRKMFADFPPGIAVTGGAR